MNQDANINARPLWLRRTTWIAINGALLFALYYALVENVESCQNIIKFMVWINFIICMIILFSGEKGQAGFKKAGPSVPSWVNGLYCAVFCGLLVWYGWFGYATMDLIVCVAQSVIFAPKSEEKEGVGSI